MAPYIEKFLVRVLVDDATRLSEQNHRMNGDVPAGR